jgi:hypothetical protein
MKVLDYAKEFLIDFFSAHAPKRTFKTTATVRNHSVSYGPNSEEPRLVTNVLFSDPGIIERYGKELAIESRELYFNTHIGDKITLALEVNPDYDESDYKSQKLRLYQPK